METFSKKNDQTKFKMFSSYIKRHKRIPNLRKMKDRNSTITFLRKFSKEYDNYIKEEKLKEKLERESKLTNTSQDDSFDFKMKEDLKLNNIENQKHAKSKLDFLLFTKMLKTMFVGQSEVKFLYFLFYSLKSKSNFEVNIF